MILNETAIDILNIDEPGEERVWQQDFASSCRSLDKLLEHLELDPRDLNLPVDINLKQFPLRVPIGYLNKIEKGNPHDPLLRQVLPIEDEFLAVPGYVRDPLDEINQSPVAGVIHKYPNRVLLVATQACAIHCRYCFRRHFPYEENALSQTQFLEAIDYIQKNSAIDEVILSGGDPMSLADAKLFSMMLKLAEIPHIKRLRIHTRLLALVPKRVTDKLLSFFEALSIPVIIVVHINHPQEIDDEFRKVAHNLKSRGVVLLNQSVLLAGINDNADTLKDLSLKLFDAQVMPYYLHLLDPVEGACHFNVDTTAARLIQTSLMGMLPGYLVPKLVTEEPGMMSKKLISIP